MSDTPDSGPAADSTGSLDQRVSRIESTLGEIKAMLAGGEHQAHDAAADHTRERLDRPTAIADEVRAQLDDRERRTADETRLDRVETTVAELRETRPEPPVRRVERFLGWR